MTTTLSLSATEAGAQITRDNVSWSALGHAASITYGFRASTPPVSYGSESSTYSRVNEAERSAVTATLGEWSAVANISFSPVDLNSFTDKAVMLVANFNSTAAKSAAHAYFPTTKNMSFASHEGDLWFNLGSDPYTDVSPGTYNYSTALHEIGHALGLAHPGNYNAGENQTATYENDAYYIEDSLQYTVMSYFDASKTGANHTLNDTTYQSVTPLRDDIVAIQRLYGANMATRTGDTTYGFNSNADNLAFHLTGDSQTIFSIWDAGGINTLDLSGYTTNQVIDLRSGAFSNAGALTKNISIALGTTIHNGSGGSGNDFITGNEVDNILRGNAGNDSLFGGGGTNAAVYSGTEKGYAITITPGASAYTILDKIGSDGIDSLTSIQELRFFDQTLSSVDFVKIRALSMSDLSPVVNLYIAETNRAPDAMGLIYWGSQRVDGITIQQMADAFFAQGETQALYPVSQTVQDFVSTVYQNLFERPADTAGLDYWAGQIEQGNISKGGFFFEVLEGVKQGTRDEQVLLNKEAVAANFALTHGLNNPDWARAVVADVNDTAASVAIARDMTNGFSMTAAAAATSELVIKVLGIASELAA